MSAQPADDAAAQQDTAQPAPTQPEPAQTQAAPQASPPPAPPPIDPAQTRLVKELQHARPLFSCRADLSGRFVCCGAHDHLVQRFDLQTDQKVELAGHRSWVRALAFHPDGNRLYSGDYAGRLIGWQYRADPPAALFDVQGHDGWIRAAAVSPDGSQLATCGNDKLVRLWSADGVHQADLVGHEHHVYNVVYHPSGGQLASCDLKGVVRHWDLSSASTVRQFDAAILWKYDTTFRADIGGARGMAFSPDGKLLACTGITDVTNAFAGVGNPLVVVLNWETGQQHQLLRPKEAFQGVAWGVVMHSAGYVIAIGGGGGGGALWFWKPDDPQPVFEMKLPAVARDLTLLPDGQRLAIACYDRKLRIYDCSPAG